jgi:hypothetical protein
LPASRALLDQVNNSRQPLLRGEEVHRRQEFLIALEGLLAFNLEQCFPMIPAGAAALEMVEYEEPTAEPVSAA